ncbi:FAD-dependent oxidoreductase [Patulibacter sp. NPDC049589]|uniref:FAD-dependent oxidoreductase n=1 Tax=Patulibacter sp. NPDC049589 TaxID=3154731 RepID=UPI00342C793A
MTNFKDHRDLADRPAPEAATADGAAQADVLVIGTGAAGHTAAVMAARAGASVLMLEVADRIGGTTWRSSGGYWIPNNRTQRERGVTMERDRALKHMASLSFPQLFDEDAERLGLPEREYELIAMYLDLAPKIIDELDDEGILGSTQMDYPERTDGMPPYFETPWDATAGSVLGPRVDEFGDVKASNPSAETMRKLGGRQGDGADLIRSLSASATRLGVEVLLEHRVDGLVRDDDGAVIGVTASTPSGPVTVHARRGVVFATGGFSHNPELAERYLPGPIVGSCSAGTARGDFIPIALEAGAELGNTDEAWWTELPIELAKSMGESPELMSFLHGASSVLVNASGERVVNEKLMYNERGKVHFQRAEDGSLPNRLLFFVYDDYVAQGAIDWPARWPVPAAGEQADYVITGRTLEDLQEKIAERLTTLEGIEPFALQPEFADGLAATIERFNGFAERGIDEDFGRGNTSNQQYDLPLRPGLKNRSLAPWRSEGPYHAMIVGAATLDTKGGPKIDGKGRVLQPGGEPIPGLFGAGNCIASPAAAAYWGGGSTIGPAIVFGYVAGSSVAAEPARAIPSATVV